MSTLTSSASHSSSNSRRRQSSYSRLESEKKDEIRSRYVTVSIMGVLLFALLASLGVIAFNIGG